VCRRGTSVLCALIVAVGTHWPGAQRPGPLAEVLAQLTVDAPRALYPHLRNVESLPCEAPFESMRALHEQLRQGISLSEELAQFVGR
jgi:hypothetical protein